MAKKKNTTPTMSPDFKITDLLRFVISLSKREQKQLLEMMDMLESMPDDEKEHVLSNIFLDPMKKGDFEDDELDDNEVEDDDVEDHDEDDYPHFLPRPNVQKFTLRVTLRGLKPAIYRKFNVPSNITLRHLSELLLELMVGRMNTSISSEKATVTMLPPTSVRVKCPSYSDPPATSTKRAIPSLTTFPKRARPSSGSMTSAILGCTTSASRP